MDYNIYVDTNVLLDVLLKRGLFYRDSLNFFLKALAEHHLYMSALSYHIIMYVMKPTYEEKKALYKKLGKVNVVSLTESILVDAQYENVKDYEDVLQFYSAKKNCRTIVTRDLKDFKKLARNSRKKIEVLTPKEWLEQNS